MSFSLRAALGRSWKCISLSILSSSLCPKNCSKIIFREAYLLLIWGLLENLKYIFPSAKLNNVFHHFLFTLFVKFFEKKCRRTTFVWWFHVASSPWPLLSQPTHHAKRESTRPSEQLGASGSKPINFFKHVSFHDPVSVQNDFSVLISAPNTQTYLICLQSSKCSILQKQTNNSIFEFIYLVFVSHATYFHSAFARWGNATLVLLVAVEGKGKASGRAGLWREGRLTECIALFHVGPRYSFLITLT